jgi:uncharacterized protein YyaL (SSP411 family)
MRLARRKGWGVHEDDHAAASEEDRRVLDWLTATIVDAIAEEEELEPSALLFLLRRYTATDRRDLGDALGRALAAGLSRFKAADLHDRAVWLVVFGETAALSDDARVLAAAAELAADLRAAWGGPAVDDASHSIDVCLAVHTAVVPEELAAAAIEELEHIIAMSYRPGTGVGHFRDDPGRHRGFLSDQVRAASALLTAYARSGRLPYSMLAEELMQFARRALWDDAAGGFFQCATGDDADRRKPFALNCEAARVLGRLAVLHTDPAYQEVAVVAREASYAADATRTLAMVAPRAKGRGAGAAIYGLALLELQSPA